MFKTFSSDILYVKSLFDFTSIYIILQAYLFSLFECNKQRTNAFTCYTLALKKLY